MEPLYKISVVKDNQKGFETKVREISAYLGIDPNWLMTVMYVESSINPKAVNKITNATGLIQFMPTTARSLGTTVEQLLTMNNVQQLDYVKSYLAPYKGRMKSLADTYLTVFYPAAVGKPDTWTFPEKVRDQNPTFNKFLVDGQLMKKSITGYLSAKFGDLKTSAVAIGKMGLPFLIIFIVLFIWLII